MKSLTETDAVLSGLKTGLMQDDTYAEFRERYPPQINSFEEESTRLLSQHDRNTCQLETKIKDHVKLVEDGSDAHP